MKIVSEPHEVSIIDEGKNKRWLCDQREYLQIGDENVQAVNVDGVHMYLGNEFAAS